ncbi:hypothetical protein G7Y89_g2396 [Cudoniella acicularis]|uniref:Class I glutamine amidotransferase-like protein n=1 Tax=Cudoniella acicularis TaxID=354080 RepID=A0A8H4RUL6_9HELO|nr:hypothetical protein G7Y89_g2396 [Cudoniella acicularis]
MAPAPPKVLIPMSDYGHDPTETAIPYAAFKKAGFEVFFATENGSTPACDKKMLEGITQKLLGATKTAVEAYKQMSGTPEFRQPLSWSAADFTLDPYNLIFLPGGHDKGVQQVIDSPIIHKHLASYFPTTRKPSIRSVAAVCHGVMVLSKTDDANGKSIIHECITTALPTRFEQVAFWGTRAFLGDYYKTYGACSDNVEEFVYRLKSLGTQTLIYLQVRKRLDDPNTQYKNSLSMIPFVVQDENYNYISARFPADAQLLAETAVSLVESTIS